MNAFISKTGKGYLFLSLFLTLGLLLPNSGSLEAQKVTPSIQQGYTTYLASSADTQAEQRPPSWTVQDYEQLLGYTPAPQDGGDYISLLTLRTNQRYEQIKALNIPQDEKALLAKKVNKKTSKKIRAVTKSINRYLGQTAKSFKK